VLMQRELGSGAGAPPDAPKPDTPKR